MIKVLLFEDEDKWITKIKEALNSYSIEIVPFKEEEKIKKEIKKDDADVYKAVLVDWMVQGELRGGRLASELKWLRPYIKLYAVTQVTEPSEIAKIIKRYPFEEELLAKKDIEDEERVKEFAFKLKNAVKEVEEVLICEPFAGNPRMQEIYLNYRISNLWHKCNEEIGDEAKKLFLEYEFKKGRNLRDVFGISKIINIKNILVARRVIFAEIFNREGTLHVVENRLGFYGEEDESFDDPYKIYVPAFKNYCSELRIKPDEFRNSGKGALPEEKKWLEDICKNFLKKEYDFPIVPRKKKTI
jgi:hypothetical protein